MEGLIKCTIIILVVGVCAFFLGMCIKEIVGIVNAVRAYKAKRAVESSETLPEGEDGAEHG